MYLQNHFLPEKFLPERPVTSDQGQWFGHEFYHDTPEGRNLKKWVLSEIEILRRAAPQDKLRGLDIGGGTGYWAKDMARQGSNVTILDRSAPDNISYIVNIRNNELGIDLNNLFGTNTNNGRLNFQKADAKLMACEDLIAVCHDERPSIFTAFNLIHFFAATEVRNLFRLISDSAADDCSVGISYVVKGDRALSGELIPHSPTAIAAMFKQEGFQPVYEDADFRRPVMHQGFRRSLGKSAITDHQ